MLVKVQTERERAIEHIKAALATPAVAAYHEALRCAVTGRPPKPLTVKSILQTADTAKVSDTNLYSFAKDISSLVATACGTAKRHKAWQASDLKSSAKRIEKAARELEAKLNEASEGARELVRLSLPSPRVSSLTEYTKFASELAEAARTANQNRPSEPWVLFRRLLVSQFLCTVARAGGKLTGGEEGSLSKAFEHLSPCLPEKFQISWDTLRLIWREWRGPKQTEIRETLRLIWRE